MSKTNCPNCGAPIDVYLSKCPYCETTYYDFSEIDISNPEPMFLKIKNGDKIHIIKCICGSCSITHDIDTVYSDYLRSVPIRIASTYETTIDLSFTSIN